MVYMLLGVPGGMELLVILLISLVVLVVPLVAAIQIHRDAEAHDVDNPVAWSLGMMFLGFILPIVGIIGVWILYTVVEVRE